MILHTIFDNAQRLSLTLEFDRKNTRYVIVLFDAMRGIERQRFTETQDEKAQDIFRQLQQAYNLK